MSGHGDMPYVPPVVSSDRPSGTPMADYDESGGVVSPDTGNGTGELKAKIATFVDRMLETEAWEESGAEAADRIMRMLDEAGWQPPLGMEPWRVDARIQEQRVWSIWEPKPTEETQEVDRG